MGGFRALLWGVVVGLGCLAGAAAQGWADTLELNDGTIFVGLYAGGDEETVRFRIYQDAKIFNRRDVKMLTFTPTTLQPPPVPRAEEPAMPLGPGLVWVPGYWQWHPELRQYLWVEGRWEPRREGWVWVPGRWERRPWGWVWIEGHWRRAGEPREPVEEKERP